MLTEEQKYRIREEEKFDAEIRNKLEANSLYSFGRLPEWLVFTCVLVLASVGLLVLAPLAL